MGCGASKSDLRSASCTEITRHPSDLGLEYLELVPSSIVEFDDTFSQAEQVLNQLVELNNDVNDCIADVRSAYAVCAGNLQLDIQAGLPDTDVVLLDLWHAHKKQRPHPTDIRHLRDNDPQLQAADAELQAAHTALHEKLIYLAAQRVKLPRAAPQTAGNSGTGQRKPGTAGNDANLQRQSQSGTVQRQSQSGPLPSTQQQTVAALTPWPAGYVQLTLSEDGLTLLSDPALPEVSRFNRQLETFRDLLGPKYSVRMSVKQCRAFATPTIRTRILRPAPSNELHVSGWYDASATVMSPATLLDIATIEAEGAVDVIKDSESALVHKTQWLSAKIKDLSSVQWQVLRRHKVTLALIIADPERRTLIRKALVDINAALYALVTCTANPDGRGTLSGAVSEVVRQLCLVLKKRWENKGGLPAPLKKLLTVSTSLSFKDAGVFGFTLHAEARPEAQLGLFPSCLPIPGQELLARIEMLSDTISNALRQLPNISAHIGTLTEQARDFFDMVPEAAAQRHMPMMEAVKAGKAVGTNLDSLFSSERLFAAFAANVRRAADDLVHAQNEVEYVLAEQGGTLDTSAAGGEELAAGTVIGPDSSLRVVDAVQ